MNRRENTRGGNNLGHWRNDRNDRKIDKFVKENVKSKIFLTENIQKIGDTMKGTNLRLIGMKEGEESQDNGL